MCWLYGDPGSASRAAANLTVDLLWDVLSAQNARVAARSSFVSFDIVPRPTSFRLRATTATAVASTLAAAATTDARLPVASAAAIAVATTCGQDDTGMLDQLCILQQSRSSSRSIRRDSESRIPAKTPEKRA